MKYKKLSSYDDYVKQQVFVAKQRIADRFSSVIEPVLKKLKIDKDSYILDVGCRRGDGVRSLIQKGYPNTFGIDIGSEFLIGDEYDENFKSADMHKTLGFNQSYKLISIIHTLEHAYDHKLVLENAYKNLDIDGYLYIIIPKEEIENSAHYFGAEKIEDLLPDLEELNFKVLETYETRSGTEYNYIAQKK